MAICADLAVAQHPLSLKDVTGNRDRIGLHALDEGYRGSYAKHFNQDNRDFPLEREAFEFTHAFFPSSIHPDIDEIDLPINEIVVGLKEKGSAAGQAFRAPAVHVEKLPEFRDLTKLKEIKNYERKRGSRGKGGQEPFSLTG